MKLSSIWSSNSQNWLEHRVSNKNPKKYREPLVQFEKIDQLIITQDRIQFIMIKYINPTSQFYQFGPNWTKSLIRINTSPRIFKFSQNTKLIKLNIKDHVYNIIGTKPNDQFQKKWLESSKTPNLKSSKNPNKMHEFMHENMKINAKGRV